MRDVLGLVLDPDGYLIGTVIGGWMSLGAGPLAQRGLDESLGITVGFGG